ncbi:hypothetical protein D6C98_10692 [Aureobasidium pullulans]|uniref:Uncharacterized protein n=1 Tax=Aureobasidium pullulans TaxID=5580 RepID=A0A4S9ZD38_AURPU|nr:hypothetical protein D6D28_10508 [Aureobasidium pullulans]THY37524.1 hypothetical protein D6C98_10692 [Aureobasidium pullulans]TIA04023.1 hypothetical protein D6C81_10643 [Aureobasidium pullulans]
MRVKALLSLVLGFAAFISAQTVECPAPQCDSGDGDGQYACGVCDPSDPQLCLAAFSMPVLTLEIQTIQTTVEV